MNVFDLRCALIEDYEGYISSFIRARNDEIRTNVDWWLEGALRPEPLIQLNPAYELGDWIDDIVKDETLHDECSSIFRAKQASADARRPLEGCRYTLELLRLQPASCLSPDDILERGSKFGTEAVAGRINPRLLELVYTAPDFEPFARDLGYEVVRFRFDLERHFSHNLLSYQHRSSAGDSAAASGALSGRSI